MLSESSEDVLYLELFADAVINAGFWKTAFLHVPMKHKN